MVGPRQAQTFSLLAPVINSSAKRASVNDEDSLMTKTVGVDKARFSLEQQPQPTDPVAYRGGTDAMPVCNTSVLLLFLPLTNGLG